MYHTLYYYHIKYMYMYYAHVLLQMQLMEMLTAC